MIDQGIMFRFTLTLLHNHPEMYDDLMRMTQPEVTEFVRETYGVELGKGTSWADVETITNIMQKHTRLNNSG